MTTVPSELWPVVYRLATSREWPPGSEIDINGFFELANRQYLLPLLMADSNLPSVLSEAKPRYRALNALYSRRYELSQAAIGELQRVIGSDSFLFLKGSYYRHRIYARPEFRPMTDIDIFVPKSSRRSFMRQLAAAGYLRKYSGYGAAFSPGCHEVSVVIKGVSIDIHRSYAQPVRNAIDYDALWQRREWFVRDNVCGNRLSPVDAILSHAFNGLAQDEFSTQLCRYVDFYMLLQQHENELNACVALARKWGIERPLFGALHVTSTLFPSARTMVVTDSIDQLLDAKTRRFLISRILPDPSAEHSGHSRGRLLQLLRKFLLIDHAWRRFAFVVYYAYETGVGLISEWIVRQHEQLPARHMIKRIAPK